MKKAMQSGDNRMTVASKHFLPNKMSEHKKQMPISPKEKSKDLKYMFYFQISLNNNP